MSSAWILNSGRWVAIAVQLRWQPTLPINASMQEFIMLGCHVAYVINASNKGDYNWHEYCVRFWLNLNYKNELDGVTWEQRLFAAVWMALTALALGEDVLVPCHQGCHRSGIVVMLHMAILAVVGSEDLISFVCFLL